MTDVTTPVLGTVTMQMLQPIIISLTLFVV